LEGFLVSLFGSETPPRGLHLGLRPIELDRLFIAHPVREPHPIGCREAREDDNLRTDLGVDLQHPFFGGALLKHDCDMIFGDTAGVLFGAAASDDDGGDLGCRHKR
jgi:hypothetical protein